MVKKCAVYDLMVMSLNLGGIVLVSHLNQTHQMQQLKTSSYMKLI